MAVERIILIVRDTGERMVNWNADNLWSIRGHFIMIGSIVYECIQITIECLWIWLWVSHSLVCCAGQVLIGVAPVRIVLIDPQSIRLHPNYYSCVHSRAMGVDHINVHYDESITSLFNVYGPKCIFTMQVQQVIVVGCCCLLLHVVVVAILLPFNIIISNTKKLCVDLVKSRSVYVRLWRAIKCNLFNASRLGR